jgi:hypothetical protein
MAIPFPSPSANVPILGQQIVVEGYTIATAARCQCQPSGSPVLLSVTLSASGLAGLPNSCAKCGTGYAIQGMQMDAQGRLLFQLAVIGSASTKIS